MKKKVFTGNEDDFHKRQKEVLDILLTETGIGAVLTGVALIDESLEILLRTCLIDNAEAKKVINPLFEGYGPLASLSAKIKLAYVLGRIDRTTYEDLEQIRGIRNYFAHTYKDASFDDQFVKDKLNNVVANGFGRKRLNFENWEFKHPKTGRKSSIPLDHYRFIMFISILEMTITLQFDHTYGGKN